MGKKVVIVLVVLIVVASGGYALFGQSAEIALGPVPVEGLDDPGRIAELAVGMTKGDPSAPITITEFADYQCPGCMGFATTVQPQVELAWVESGRAKFVFFDFPLVSIHPHAFLAARAARCAADQDLFWEYHDVLFRRQATWAASPTPPLSAFEDFAAEAGLDQRKFRSCLRSDRHAALVTANMALAQELGVEGTPTVMISKGEGTGQRPADSSFESIRRLMESFEGADAGGRP